MKGMTCERLGTERGSHGCGSRALLTLNTSYFQAKALQSAVELRLFDTLAEKPLSAADLCARLWPGPGPCP